MSDPTPNPENEGGNSTGGQTPTAGDGFRPITTQDEFNQAVSERIKRERAKYADYDDIKAKAARVDEVEASVQAKAREVEDALAGVPAEVTKALRTHLAAVHKIGDEDAELFLTAHDPETLLKQVERLTARSPGKTNHVPREGDNPRPKEDELRTFVRGVFPPKG